MTNAQPKNVAKPKIKIVSVGGKACNILARLHTSLKDNASVECVAIAKTGKIFNQASVTHKIELRTEKSMDELDEKSQEQINHNIINEKKDEIKEFLADGDILFVLGNLSNKTNVTQMEKVISFVNRKNVPVIFFGSYPFSFEGEAQMQSAVLAGEKMSQLADATIVVDNNKLLVKGFNAQEAFTTVDSVIAKYVTALIEIVDNFGVINVDFNDFKTTITNAGDAFFNTATGSQADVPKLLADVFNHNYLATKFDGMKKIVYVIKAGSNLAIETVEKIGQAIYEKAAKDSRIIFGIANDPDMKEEIQVTLIAGHADTLAYQR